MVEQMVERVEVAIRKELFEQAGIVLPKMDLGPVARAAIGAMRCPPDEALGIHGYMDIGHAQEIRNNWARVIECALTP